MAKSEQKYTPVDEPYTTPNGRVLVKLNGSFRGLREGEVAGFRPGEAKDLVAERKNQPAGGHYVMPTDAYKAEIKARKQVRDAVEMINLAKRHGLTVDEVGKQREKLIEAKNTMLTEDLKTTLKTKVENKGLGDAKGEGDKK